jgi:hypothetical protein
VVGDAIVAQLVVADLSLRRAGVSLRTALPLQVAEALEGVGVGVVVDLAGVALVVGEAVAVVLPRRLQEMPSMPPALPLLLRRRNRRRRS